MRLYLLRKNNKHFHKSYSRGSILKGTDRVRTIFFIFLNKNDKPAMLLRENEMFGGDVLCEVILGAEIVCPGR